MNPLYEKYFFGELTDTEEQTLEQMLTQSESEAWDFGQTAEEVYHRYGLPEPELPGGSGEGIPPGAIKPWKWLIPLSGLLFLGAYWLWKQPLSQLPLKQREPAVPSLPAPVMKVIKRAVPSPKAGEPAVKVPEAHKETPPEEAGIKESGNNLKVVVRRETAGPVTVKVSNSLGLEIRRLYGGMLQTGRWSFEWDGRFGDGRLVEPGKYRIEVQTEGTTQSREIVIR